MVLKIMQNYSVGRGAAGNRVGAGMIVIVCSLICSITTLYAAPPWLHVDGNKIKDPNGDVVVLRGVSMVDLGTAEEWQGGAINTIDRITDADDSQGISPGWYTRILRVPIAPHDSPLCNNSPLTFNPYDPNDPCNPLIRALLRDVVDYCAEKEVYVIIDWHHMYNTGDKVDETNAFWAYMAPEFADDSHVLFELFNEPVNSQVSDEDERWLSVKEDMETWITTVRASAPRNLILVGTPSYCQILAPVVDNPITDSNIVYVCHTYPYHWLGRGASPQWYIDHITACVAEYPVICTEWGFTNDPAYYGDNPVQFFDGTISTYGLPLKAFFEQYGIGNTAWVATYNWSSPMFRSDWRLRSGEGEMGCFTKDWLYEKNGPEQTIPLTVTKCKVKAGKIQGDDSFDASGTFQPSPLMLTSLNQADINIVSLAEVDDELIYTETIDFNTADVINSKFTHKYKIPRGETGAITSLKIDFYKKTFAIKAKKIDLTGLACPLRLDITIGNSVMSGEVDETIVNGSRKTIPTRLMRQYKDTLIVTKAKAKHNSTKPLSDSLSVKGEIAVANISDLDINEPNLVLEDVNIVWGDQTFTVLAGSFTAARTGHSYKCKKVDVDPNDATELDDGVVTAKIDLDKCKFTLTVKNADSIYAEPNDVNFGVNFADFNEVDDVNLALGY